MQITSYYTVKGYGEHEVNIQKSRFIAQVSRSETEEQAQAFIKEIRKKHWNATHNCFAYMIGEMNGIQKANDDGEPGGTAGIPILEVIKKRELKDTVVVVTRYFGGIKLGAGGLIRAYGRAASEGLDAAGIIKRRLVRVMHVDDVEYSLLGKLENELGSSLYVVKDTRYLEKVGMDICVPFGEEEGFAEWMVNLTNGQVKITQGDTEYLDRVV